ncbi:hypothetical protein ACIRFH_07960 [Streptomyces sp. NPDC093586]|uniref:hypothetical protein n=1 Tax=Streptomyces sp. NPDC093586 TaxID=3366042 RepID=UPI0037F1ADAA
MSTRKAFLWFVFYFWILAASGTLVAYYIPWVGGTRVPGRLLGRVPLLKRLGRHSAKGRLAAVKSELDRRLDSHPESTVLTSEQLIDQVHAHATWVPLSRAVFAAPGMLACAALALLAPSAWHTSSLWAIGVYFAFFQVSVLLTCIDIWAVRNADSAGTVTAVAVGVLESFTTRAGAAPAKTTPAAWQSQMVEQLCTALVRRAHRETVGTVPGSRFAMAQNTATVVRALRHRTALVHGNAVDEGRATAERELWLLICNILTYSSRPRADVTVFRVADAGRLADVPQTVPDATAVPSPKARVLVPLLFLCVLMAMAVGFGVTGAAAEFTGPIVIALAMAATHFVRRFGVTVFDSFAEPSAPPATTGEEEPRPMPEAVRRAA